MIVLFHFGADGWSTNDLKGVYCNTITCHFINPQWELTELVVDVSDLEQRHTSINLIEKWSKVISSFDLKENILGMTVDGASDYSSASKKFAKIAVWCACHRMHLISDKIINDNADLKVNKWQPFGIQVSTSSALIEKQQELGKLHGRKYPRLQTGIYTRWNSHIKMIRSLITNKEVLEPIPEVRHLLFTAD